MKFCFWKFEYVHINIFPFCIFDSTKAQVNQSYNVYIFKDSEDSFKVPLYLSREILCEEITQGSTSKTGEPARHLKYIVPIDSTSTQDRVFIIPKNIVHFFGRMMKITQHHSIMVISYCKQTESSEAGCETTIWTHAAVTFYSLWDTYHNLITSLNRAIQMTLLQRFFAGWKCT